MTAAAKAGRAGGEDGRNEDLRPRLDPAVEELREAARSGWRRSGLYSDLTLAAEFDRSVTKWPDCSLIYSRLTDDEDLTLTLSTIRDRAVDLSAGLRGLGLTAGDALAIQLPNWPEALITYYAAAKIGLVIVPIPDIYSAAELKFILAETAARGLVMPALWRQVSFEERLGDARTTDLEHLILVGGEEALGTASWGALCASIGEAASGQSADLSPRDPAVVIYTSGGSANPKGVVHSHESFLAEVHASPFGPEGDGSERYLLCSPPGHIAGLLGLLRSTVFGCDSYVLDVWDPGRARLAVDRYGLTASAGPFFLETLLDRFQADGKKPPPMKWGLGGSPVSPALSQRAEAAGWLSLRSYGSSEHPTVTGARFSDSAQIRTRTDGYALGGNAVRIIDADGVDCRVGTSGELVCSGPEQFLGYLSPQLNSEAFTADGWFRTGDVGILDDDGCLVLTDRLKDIIIRGGENISALEVEEALRRHPSIAEVAVVPYADPRYGEKVAACVTIRLGSTPPTPTDLVDFFRREGIAKQKTPERVITLPVLPRTIIGKIDKQRLRQLAAGEDVST